MLTANPLEYRYTVWVHSSAEPLQSITFDQNRWNRIRPSIGSHDVDDRGILLYVIMIKHYS